MAAHPLLRTLANAILPDDVATFWQDHLAPMKSAQPRGRVVAITPATTQAVTLTIAPNAAFQGFRAGQHITLAACINGAWVARSYSPRRLAGARRGEFHITVQRVNGGRFSEWAMTHARVGDWLKLSAAYGDLALPSNQAPLHLLAAGSGITPFLSLLQEAPPARPIHLQYWVKQADDACHINELIARQAHDAHFRFSLHCTQGTQAAARLNVEHLADCSADTELMACGPAGFVASAQALATTLKLRLQSEAFSLPVVVSDATQQVSITLARSGKTVQVAAGAPLLPALEAQGIALASGCRRGICNTCACGKRSGISENIITHVRDDSDTPSLRLCISSARSDLTLDV